MDRRIMVVVYGLPATGKSTLMSKLKVSLIDSVALYIDDFWTSLFDAPTFTKDQAERVFEELLLACRTKMMTRQHLLVEGVFATEHRLIELRKLAISQTYSPIFVRLKASIGCLLKRINEREKSVDVDRGALDMLSSRMRSQDFATLCLDSEHLEPQAISACVLQLLKVELRNVSGRIGSVLDLQAQDVLQYCRDTSSPEPSAAIQIREDSERLPSPHMICGPVIGSILRLLAAKSRRVLEIGTFSGYSAAMIASSLPVGAKLLTFEKDESMLSLALSNLNGRKVAQGKIEVRSGDGLAWLKQYDGPLFDLIFLDCDKDSIAGYESLLIRKLSLGGYLVVDNSLARGGVLSPKQEWQRYTVSTNRFLRDDERLLVANLPLRDGLLVCRRVATSTGCDKYD